ncbi:sensor histidine kinase [Actinophytocola oryzae]|uniref:histidine kinase n=1 Tax=Actinophytocola oryzae TaxID=502181 RepID=A0A4R7W240_9PSEU|nr:nitrate- and nitrite sensing domain-containing protein [Actinophytocola oryzae]TDV56185.1 signal transduction histidine kinase [Actinophytocola oryzae]
MSAADDRPLHVSRNLWRTIVQWRNWPLLVKLGMVLVVPVVAALVLGVLRVVTDVQLANSYGDIERIANLRVELVRTLSAVQRERSAAVAPGADFPTVTKATDAAVATMKDTVRNTPDLGDNATQRYRELSGMLGVLGYARQQLTGGNEQSAQDAQDAYAGLTTAMLEFDRSLVGRFPDEALANTAIALNELQSAREQVSLQEATGLLGMKDGSLSDTDKETLSEAEIQLNTNLEEFQSVAPQQFLDRYDGTVTGSAQTQRTLLVVDARGSGEIGLPFTEAQWRSTFDTTANLTTEVTGFVAKSLRSQSAVLAASYRTSWTIELVLLLVVVLLAVGIGGGLGRYLLRTVGQLRSTALDVAHNQLPAAVRSIRAGQDVGIPPVPLRTTEEFGQLAKAFDTVLGQAVSSAGEEARLRSTLSDMLTNLSRRSQGLVQRQLRLMEQLEQGEDDPDKLSNLFKVDHLATRMRRNNENLIILSGGALHRQFAEPVQLADVLRAAVSEVEHYERAVIQSAPQCRIAAFAAGDLIRSISELIDNAAAFSPPDSQVVVAGRLTEDGSVVVEILDEGVGMAEAELREANHRIAFSGTDVPVSRQLGLFVVGRLTAKYDIRAHLTPRGDGSSGTRAMVLVPAELLNDADQQAGPAPEPVTEVVDRLESAGIIVRLPVLPTARTPASILFAAHVPADAPPMPAGFNWLKQRSGMARAATTQQVAVQTVITKAVTVEPPTGPNGLPKRVPKGQLRAGTAHEPPAAQARDAAKARGFLNGFQSGIRSGQNEKGDRRP